MRLQTKREKDDTDRLIRVLRARVTTAETTALQRASEAIEAAIARTLAEYPDEPAMGARVLGMRAAQRLVWGDPAEEGR